MNHEYAKKNRSGVPFLNVLETGNDSTQGAFSR